MADQPAAFLDHRVTPEGLYIRGISPGQTLYGAISEIFVPREEAELFGWIDPLEDEEEEIDEEEKNRLKQRFAGVDTRSLKHLLRSNKDNGPFDEYLQAVQKEVQRREET